MKICIIGLGSIGKRHLTNLREYFNANNMACSIDALRNTNSPLDPLTKANIQNEYHDIEELPSDYDIIYITNPTYLHYEFMIKTEDKGKFFYIEKPIFHKLDPLMEDFIQNHEPNKYYIACPLRYHPVIDYVKNTLDLSKIYSIRAISSSYLPSWRTHGDYRDNYSSKKEYGGGVSLDLIHEWDYITYLFGFPKKTFSINKKVSHLELTSDDISIYIGEYEDKLVEIHLDYFGRNTIRSIELYTQDGTYFCNIFESYIELRNKETKKITFSTQDIYKNELEFFMNIINNKQTNTNSLSHAYKVLEIAIGGN